MSMLQQLNLYVVRHGECRHNIDRKIGSHGDSPLTQRGREQATASGRLLMELLPALDRADYFASPLHRACTTLELMLTEAGIDPANYQADHRLMEMNWGNHIGLTWDAVPPQERAEHEADPWNYRPKGGESQADVFARVGKFLEGLKRDAVIVTHAVPVRMIRAHYLGIPPSAVIRYQPPNAGMLRLSSGSEAYFEGR